MGLKLTIVMPECMSEERKKLMKAYGSTLVLTPGCDGVVGSCRRAEEIQKATENSLVVGQFANPSNPMAHVLSTAPEIVAECKKLNVVPSYFLCGIGSGGTVTGCSQVLRKEFPNIKIIVFEPSLT
jgi:cysteine synthase A